MRLLRSFLRQLLQPLAMFLARWRALVALLAGAAAFAAPPSVRLQIDAPVACTAHVEAPRAISWRCGERLTVTPPAVAWAETPDGITPFVADVSAGGAFRFATFVPKGTVVVHDESSSTGSARVLSLQAPRDEKLWRSPFQTTAPVNSVISVPRGRAIAMLLDERGRVIGVSDPLTVEATPVAWEHRYDRGRSVLMATIDRGSVDGDVKLFASDAGGRRSPDAVVSGVSSMTAVWYRLHDGPVRIAAESPVAYLPDAEVEIRGGSVAEIRGTLHKRPSLNVSITSSGDSKASSLSHLNLDVVRAGEGSAAPATAVRVGRSYAFPNLPPEILTLRLHGDGVELERTVDLSSGNDADVALRLQPIIVTGTLYRGDQPSKGEVRFEQRGAPVVALADDFGRYEATLWQARRYIVSAVAGQDSEQPAYAEDRAITESTELDIHVPANALRVRVTDGDARPVERGSISVHDRWAAGGTAVVVPIQGESTPLPPQHTGVAEVRVRAPGYGESAPITIQVDDQLRDRVIDVKLDRDKNSVMVTIRLTDGAAAREAEVSAFAAGRMTWHGVADDGGVVALPAAVARGRVIVRHPAAASKVVIFGDDQRENAVTLDAPAPPLVAKVVHRDGRAVGPASARISIWLVGGQRLSGDEAGFATWSFGGTTPDGLFVAKGLGQNPVRLLATTKASRAQTATGMFDAASKMIPYPWPPVATIVPADE